MDNLNDILKDRIISEINTDENTVVIHLKPKEKRLPKSWEEFCEMFPMQHDECFITDISEIRNGIKREYRAKKSDRNMLPDRTTAEAILALCQLIQLRDCYNGDWVSDWRTKTDKYVIYYKNNEFVPVISWHTPELLYFKTKELCDDFLRNFRPLIEKLKPLYGIKEGGKK